MQEHYMAKTQAPQLVTPQTTTVAQECCQTYIPLDLIDGIVDDRVILCGCVHTVVIDGPECTLCRLIFLHNVRVQISDFNNVKDVYNVVHFCMYYSHVRVHSMQARVIL